MTLLAYLILVVGVASPIETMKPLTDNRILIAGQRHPRYWPPRCIEANFVPSKIGALSAYIDASDDDGGKLHITAGMPITVLM